MGFPRSQAFVHFDAAKRTRFSKSLETKEIEIPPFSLFASHGYLQHAAS